MKDDDHRFLGVADLARRGWTESLIRRFLGAPDRWQPVDHWMNSQGQRAYRLNRIQEVEGNAEFERAFKLSIRRRRVSSRVAATFLRERKQEVDSEHSSRSLPSIEDQRFADVIERAAASLQEARSRGLRTPHNPK